MPANHALHVGTLMHAVDPTAGAGVLASMLLACTSICLQWTDPQELHGIGQYAADAYWMFCRGRWQQVDPADKDLRRYRDWLQQTGGEGAGLQVCVCARVLQTFIFPSNKWFGSLQSVQKAADVLSSSIQSEANHCTCKCKETQSGVPMLLARLFNPAMLPDLCIAGQLSNLDCLAIVRAANGVINMGPMEHRVPVPRVGGCMDTTQHPPKGIPTPASKAHPLEFEQSCARRGSRCRRCWLRLQVQARQITADHPAARQTIAARL
eukprot:scaffold288368_cov21-Tisochrysis_lutea.AAC.1